MKKRANHKIKGYICIYQPTHPNCDGMKYVRRSRLVMEKHIGRYLLPEEVVHHINKITDDDRIENLQLFKSHAQHMEKAHGDELRKRSYKLINTGRTRFKIGQHPSTKTEFKKGCIPWNKGLKLSHN